VQENSEVFSCLDENEKLLTGINL